MILHYKYVQEPGDIVQGWPSKKTTFNEQGGDHQNPFQWEFKKYRSANGGQAPLMKSTLLLF